MPKLSVYVPDDLWAEARGIDAEITPSALLQELLRARIHEHKSRPYRRLTSELETELAKARAVVVDRVAEAYQAGYAVGLAFAPNLPWTAFERLVESGWDVKSWRETFENEEYEWMLATPEDRNEGVVVVDWRSALAAAVDESVGYLPLDQDGVPVGVGAEGFTDALRDLWTGTARTAAGQAESSGTIRLVTPGEEG
jgi:hypothetical protein